MVSPQILEHDRPRADGAASAAKACELDVVQMEVPTGVRAVYDLNDGVSQDCPLTFMGENQ